MSTPSRQEYRVEGLPEPVSHYTDAVRWGDLLFVSGCVGVTADGQVAAPGDAAGQAQVALGYVDRALRAAGTDFQHVLKVTVFLTQIADRGAVNQVRENFFGKARPASTLVEVSSLILPGLLVEVEAVAGIPA